MAEKQVPGSESPTFTAPPLLQLLETDAAAGLCVDGHCVLPPAEKTHAAG